MNKPAKMRFGKSVFTFSLCNLLFAFSLVAQDENDETRSWTPEFGYTRVISLKDSITHLPENNMRGIDLRFISPRFELITDETYFTDERKKHPEKFKRARFSIDMLYGYRHRDHYYEKASEYAIAGDFYYAILCTKRFCLDAIAGLKLDYVVDKDYGLINFKKLYYYDVGLSAQLDLGFISPFIDLRRNFYTMGTEITLHPVYRKPKRRYKLHKFLG
jgi:hypothetical protein